MCWPRDPRERQEREISSRKQPQIPGRSAAVNPLIQEHVMLQFGSTISGHSDGLDRSAQVLLAHALEAFHHSVALLAGGEIFPTPRAHHHQTQQLQ